MIDQIRDFLFQATPETKSQAAGIGLSFAIEVDGVGEAFGRPYSLPRYRCCSAAIQVIAKWRGNFSPVYDLGSFVSALVSLVNGLFTTFGELCAHRNPVLILFRVHGISNEGTEVLPGDFAHHRQ